MLSQSCKKQGIEIALSFPENDPSGIRDKVFNEIAVTTLKEENGVETLITYLNTLFRKDELCEVYERYTTFDRYSKTDEVKMDDFILAFERLYNRIKQKEMALPQVVLAFKLLEASKISHRDRQLVLTGVNYEQKETLFDQMKNSLRKFHGEQSLTSLESQACGTSTIKYEPKTESTFYTQKSQNFYQKYRGRGRGNTYYRKPSYRKYEDNSGNNSGNLKSEDQHNHNKVFTGTRSNPNGYDGKPMRCKICESTMHLVKDCPHKDESVYVAESDSSDIILFTGNQKEEMSLLTKESLYSAVLDSGCSSTVAGKHWMSCYLESLSEDIMKLVKRKPGHKVFKFGGNEIKKSIEVVEIPCILAGKWIRLSVDVVDSNIPLLLSKESMKCLKVKLDLKMMWQKYLVCHKT